MYFSEEGERPRTSTGRIYVNGLPDSVRSQPQAVRGQDPLSPPLALRDLPARLAASGTSDRKPDVVYRIWIYRPGVY